MKTKKKANTVLKLLKNTPDGIVTDADTILADLVENADFHMSGIAKEIIQIWKQSEDRKSVEHLFETFTDTCFDNWLDQSIRETTRPKSEAE